jgi:hypothetical protein
MADEVMTRAQVGHLALSIFDFMACTFFHQDRLTALPVL